MQELGSRCWRSMTHRLHPIQICLIHAYEFDKIHLTDIYCHILHRCRSSAKEWMRESIKIITEVHDEFVCGDGIRIAARIFPNTTESRWSHPHCCKSPRQKSTCDKLIVSFIFVFYLNTRNRNENFVLNF